MHAQRSLDISMDDEKKSIRLAEDKYRSFLHDADADTQWRDGTPPNFDQVNLLFEEGQTKVYNHFISTSYIFDIVYIDIIHSSYITCLVKI